MAIITVTAKRARKSVINGGLAVQVALGADACGAFQAQLVTTCGNTISEPWVRITDAGICGNNAVGLRIGCVIPLPPAPRSPVKDSGSSGGAEGTVGSLASITPSHAPQAARSPCIPISRYATRRASFAPIDPYAMMRRQRPAWGDGLALWALRIEAGPSRFLVFPLLFTHFPAPVLRRSDPSCSRPWAPHTSVKVCHFPLWEPRKKP